jgi:hypothetical protein
MKVEDLDHTQLVHVNGAGFHLRMDDVENLGKAAVNGAVNTLNFFHEHPITIGKAGTFSVGGSRVTKPFTNDPLSHLGVVKGRAVPAKK